MRQGHVADATFWARPGLKSGGDKGIEEGHVGDTAAFNGMPDPVLHLAARAMGVVTGLAALEPDPRKPGADVLLNAAPPPPACSDSYRHPGIDLGRMSDQPSMLRG